MSSSEESRRSDGGPSETVSGPASGTEPEDGAEDEPDFTPQPTELRRQQYAVGVGAAIIAGFAVAISSIQHFPGLHEAIPLVAGFVGAGLVYWIVQRSLFPTSDELPASE